MNFNINDSINEMIEMILNDGEWEDNECQNLCAISIPKKNKINDDSTLLSIITIKIKSILENKNLLWGFECINIMDEDSLYEIGDEENYIQFEFLFTRHTGTQI